MGIKMINDNRTQEPVYRTELTMGQGLIGWDPETLMEVSRYYGWGFQRMTVYARNPIINCIVNYQGFNSEK